MFHTGFVAVYQGILLWSIAAPSALLASRGRAPLGTADAALAGAFLALLALETWADEAQWAFQSQKHAMTPAARARAGGDFARGFITSGPFRFSRHPNFVSEFSMWLVFAGFPVAAGGVASYASGALLGPLLLVMLFFGSTAMTEHISASKYPLYAVYQRTTSQFIPFFPGEPLPEAGDAAAKTVKTKAAPTPAKRAASSKRS